MTTPLALDEAAATADVWPPILSVDPGSQHTGCCLRMGRDALEAVTVERAEGTGDHREAVAYAVLAAEIADSLVDRHADEIRAEAERRGFPLPPPCRTAVETLLAPTAPAGAKGRRAAIAPLILSSLPVAATVLGFWAGRHPSTILVAPRGGSMGGWEGLPREVYPASLIDRKPAAWIAGGCERRHQRSAFALAGAAHVLASQATATAPSAPAEAQSAAPDDLRSLVGEVVAQVVTLRPDPGSAASVLAAVRVAMAKTFGAEAALAGSEARLVAACAPRLLGCSAADAHERAERLRAEAVVLLSGQVKA